MPLLKKIPFNYREIIVKHYNTKDFLSDDHEFEMNRGFDSWADYFKERLSKVRKHWVHWKLSYAKMAKKIPAKVIADFLPLLMEDLIKHNVEFVVNPRCKTPNQFILKICYIVRRRKRRYRWRYIVSRNGKNYYMRVQYPQNWKSKEIKRYCYLHPAYRAQLNREIKKGKQYYNSNKEKILSQL